MSTELLTVQKTSRRFFPASTWIYLALTSILSIFVIAPLLYPGYIQTHRGFMPLWDLAAPSGAVALPEIAGPFDAFRSDGLLPYFLARLLPVSPLVAVKFILATGWLLGGLGLFLWLQNWLGAPAAMVAALVYTYLPYRIVVVYVRGDWGEALFWGLLPWAALAAAYLVSSPRMAFLPITAAFWLLTGLSQLGLTLWAGLLVGLMLLVVHPRQAVLPLAAVVAGILATLGLYAGLSAFAGPSPIPFADHFLYPFQLFSAQWGFGVSQPGWNDRLSFQLGFAAVGLGLVALTLWQLYRPDNAPASPTDRRLLFFSLAPVSLSLLALGAARFIWAVPVAPGYTLADTLTYPWQLLGLAGLCLAILSGAAFWLAPRLADLPLLAATVSLTLLASYTYLQPQFIQPDPRWLARPQALLGDNQLALLDHRFEVVISGDTAGLHQGQTAIPLSSYGPLHPGDILRLRVVWQPLRPFDHSLKVFVHLVDPAGAVIVQYDAYPRQGDYSTDQWIPGEIIEDAYLLHLPLDLPPGPYRVYLGLYNEATLTRLPVPNDTEGRVILDVR